MHRAANIINFLTGQSSRLGFVDFEIPASTGKLFQHILANRAFEISNSRALFTQLAYNSIQLAEHAYCLRDWNSIEEASVILMNLPLAGAKYIGTYYQAIAINRRGQKEEALKQFETIIDKAPFVYRARATQSSAMIQRERGEFDEALRLNLEALRMASTDQGNNLLVRMWANWEIGLIKSLNDDHQQALEDLERDLPIIRAVARHNPFYHYIYHADLAYELGHVGRIAEAEAAINIALASPFAQAYPEWSETRDEIEQKRNYTDPSRCFLDRSLAESEASPDSTSSPLVEADVAIQPERATEIKPVRALAICRFVGQSIYQRPLTLPNAALLFIPGGIAKSFLQRLGRSVQLRGPPTFPLL